MQRARPAPEHEIRIPHGFQLLGDMLLVAAIVIAAAVVGAHTRLGNTLAAFWPANALLLGLFLRNPELSGTHGWIAATLAHMVAGLLVNDSPLTILWLTSANMLSVATGYLLFQQLSAAHRGLQRPGSVLWLVGIAFGASLSGAISSAWSTPAILEQSPWTGFAQWLSSEWINFVILLPAALTAPNWRLAWKNLRRPRKILWRKYRQTSPLLLLASLCIAGHASGNPWAMLLLPVPGLLWCATRFSLFGTALLVMGYGVWHMTSVWNGITTPQISFSDLTQVLMLRASLLLLVCLPLLAAGVSWARRQARLQAERQAGQDPLTQQLTGRAFADKAGAMLAQSARHQMSVTVGLLDIDQLKAFNIAHGHVTGDTAICTVAHAVRRHLRETDLLGRMGGGEFAFIAPCMTPQEGLRMAERLCASVAQQALAPHDARLTISIGVVHADVPADGALIPLLATARCALQRAKQQGGDCVVQAPVTQEPSENTIGLVPAGLREP